MGAELLKFSGFFDNRELLKEFSCSNCQQSISEQDIKQKNYALWVSDYANDISKTYTIGNQSCYSLTFWLKGVEHQDCPEMETCESCYERFLTSAMKEFEGDYYCLSCWQVDKEVKHE